jgi:hypothetical protein
MDYVTIIMIILACCMFAISVLCFIHDRNAALMEARMYRALAHSHRHEAETRITRVSFRRHV